MPCIHLVILLIDTDLEENRLQKAKELGADHTVKVTSRDSRAVAEQITKTLGCQADHTIECTGAQPSIATAIYVSAGLATI